MKINLKDIKEFKHNFNYQSDEQYEVTKNTIKLRGIHEPIVLRDNPLIKGEYIIVSGHYRIRALRDLGYKFIPNEKISEKQIVIINVNEEDALIQLHDYNVRGKRDPLEYIRYLEYCMKKLNIDSGALAHRLGINRKRLSHMLAISRCSNELKYHLNLHGGELIKTNRLTMKHLEQLARLNGNSLQFGIYDTYIYNEGVSANKLKGIIDKVIDEGKIEEGQLISLEAQFNARKVKARLEVLEAFHPKIANIVREFWYPLRYEKNTYRDMEREINIRLGQPKRVDYFLPTEKYTVEQAKEYADKHMGEYIGIETKSWHRIYVVANSIEELRERFKELREIGKKKGEKD